MAASSEEAELGWDTVLPQIPLPCSSLQVISSPMPTQALSPKKLLLTKWTAVHPQNKEKHFLVTKVIEPEPPSTLIADIEVQAVHSGRVMTMHWRALTDAAIWTRGWV